MQIVTKTKELNKIIKEYKKQGKTIGLVPTMGALHKGHKSLIDTARKDCDVVVVSVFVNPIQFGANEDFDKYPRIFNDDCRICENSGCDIVFHPEPDEMYPEYNKNAPLKENLNVKNLSYTIKVPEKYTNKLCGKSRPGHFDGVCTVVLKLFNIVQPDNAYFGQKDIQQLIIIKNMVKNLNLAVNVTGCPIVRENNGLALSSRNSYLSNEDKEKASSIFKALSNMELMFNNGETDKEKIFSESLKFLDKAVEIEYVEACNVKTLDYSSKISNNTFIAIAVKINGVRLIDNVVLN